MVLPTIAWVPYLPWLMVTEYYECWRVLLGGGIFGTYTLYNLVIMSHLV